MPIDEETQEAVAHELRKNEPLIDIDQMKADFLDWLQQLEFPANAKADTWEESLKIIPHSPGGKQLESGVKIRLSLTLYTHNNKYLLSVMECFHPKSRGTYIFTVHTNWDETEKRILKRIEEQYAKIPNDNLQARHTIWAQTFRDGQLHDALTAGAIAILSHELTGIPPQSEIGTPVSRPSYSPPMAAPLPRNREDEETVSETGP